ncbi:MAG: serine/threonine protein kinase [Alphaproteobacteria bacterium]|nr:serine/threonine protein kinase [Alphaproteobacteria bacterium]
MKRNNKILDWLDRVAEPSESQVDTLKRIVQNKTKAKQFLKIITQNPRDNKPAYRQIRSFFPVCSDWHQWLWGYNRAYVDFMNGLFQQADCVADILKVIPNLSPWTLEQKFDKVIVGKIPGCFGSEKSFLSLIQKIRKSGVVRTFKHIKKLECRLPDFKKAFPAVQKIDWWNFSARSDFLWQLMREQCGRPFTVCEGKQKYHVSFLCNPFSNKMVFQVKVSDKQTFILKMAPYAFLTTCNERVRKEHEALAIRPDSIYSDALLEFYLKLNRCPHAPDILYYRYDYEVALYAMETGKPLPFSKKGFDFYTFNTQIIPDSIRLGIYMNDINAGNFMISDKDGAIKIIDIGHATFANPLTPGVPGITFMMGNLCGRDYMSINGVLDVEDV